MQNSGFEANQMYPKVGDRRAQPDAGRINLIGSFRGWNNPVKKLEFLI